MTQTPVINAEQFRREQMHTGLQQAALDPDPYRQFERWLTEAVATDIPEPTAMCLATVGADGQPWQRMVLLKVFDTRGFVFFTNYASRKAAQMATHPRVSLLFPWHALGRQVKITGQAEKISLAESAKYFATRPRGSQIGAWASPQSQVITSRAMLDTLFEEMKQKFADGHIPLPSFWGGFRVVPTTLEFWQARDNRLHDRFLYQPSDSAAWRIERLAP